MAKKSLILKNIENYKKSLFNVKNIKNIKINLLNNNSMENYFKLFNIKKKKLFVKFKKRCYISGRNRSVYSRFYLNRNFIRKIGSFGNIIGLEKSSW
ncbi:uS14 family ribosomal protein [Candidatus Carsonella ruddii]|uniref:uS14 family ribosomal protein n=1 Tax=Carsonella ruddii TaxID=114186 RepID=UPI003D9A83CB